LIQSDSLRGQDVPGQQRLKHPINFFALLDRGIRGSMQFPAWVEWRGENRNGAVIATHSSGLRRLLQPFSTPSSEPMPEKPTTPATSQGKYREMPEAEAHQAQEYEKLVERYKGW
jgi:hypothetical protein